MKSHPKQRQRFFNGYSHYFCSLYVGQLEAILIVTRGKSLVILLRFQQLGLISSTQGKGNKEYHNSNIIINLIQKAHTSNSHHQMYLKVSLRYYSFVLFVGSPYGGDTASFFLLAYEFICLLLVLLLRLTVLVALLSILFCQIAFFAYLFCCCCIITWWK